MHQRGLELMRQRRFVEAEQFYARLVLSDASDWSAWNMLGVAKANRGRYEDSLDVLRRGLRSAPDSPELHHNVGFVLRALGDFAGAERHYREAIGRRPGYAEAYFNLASVRTFSSEDPIFDGIRRLLARADLPPRDFCFLHFAAGKVHDDCGAYEEAFLHFAIANANRGARFDAAGHLKEIDRMIGSLDEDAVSRHAGLVHAATVPVPIFVIGQPRSGTSLVEQILASHPDVHGAGELAEISTLATRIHHLGAGTPPYPHCVRVLTPGVIAACADSYLATLRKIAPSASHVVDKMPHNYLFLGFIAVILPSARIIHCRRHPLDTCLSAYFQRFQSGQEQSYDLANLGHCYRGYRRLMDHWLHVLRLSVFEVDYESLVSNPEGRIRAVLTHCGLSWHPACLRCHETERPVSTASSYQVRQPIYHTSVGRWRNYERHLGALVNALESRSEAFGA